MMGFIDVFPGQGVDLHKAPDDRLQLGADIGPVIGTHRFDDRKIIYFRKALDLAFMDFDHRTDHLNLPVEKRLNGFHRVK